MCVKDLEFRNGNSPLINKLGEGHNLLEQGRKCQWEGWGLNKLVYRINTTV